MVTTLAISAHDAETDAPVGLFKSASRDVHFTVVVIPVKAGLSGDVEAAVDSLAAESANGPLGPEDPDDKLATSTPLFGEIVGPFLSSYPTLYKVKSGYRTITLYPVVDTIGWYVAAIPKDADDFAIEPRLYFVTADAAQENLPFTFYSHDLTPLAKLILQLREKAKPELAMLAQQWGGESAVVWDMVHNYVENGLWSMVTDDRLKAFWINDLSWAVLDFEIPAREFDLLVERRAQVQEVLNEVPWPELPFFESCALGIPVTLGKDGVSPYTILNHRLFVPSFSAYFPRETNQIKSDLGLLWLTNLGPIFDCVVKKAVAKAEEAQKTAKFWKFVSIITPLMLLPTPVTLVTGVSELVKYFFLQNVNPALVAALNFATSTVVSLVSGGAAEIGTGISLTIYENMVKQLKTFLEAKGLEELKQLAKDVKQLTGLVQSETGLGDVPLPLVPFVTWCLRVGILDVLIAQLLSDILEADVDPQANITFPAIGAAQQAGVPVSPGLLALVNGDDPAFPAQAPSAAKAVPVVVGGTALAAGGVLAYLYFTGKL